MMEAWDNHFSFENPFCAQAEAAIQAFRMAQDLNLDRVTFKGDAQNMTFKGMSKFEDCLFY